MHRCFVDESQLDAGLGGVLLDKGCEVYADFAEGEANAAEACAVKKPGNTVTGVGAMGKSDNI